MALLGKSSEEVFIEALRGCNQHKHKPGCPDADGVGQEDKQVSDSLLNGVWEHFDGLTYKSENWDQFQPMDIKNALRELLKKEKNAPDPNNEEAMFKFAKDNIGTVYEALTGRGAKASAKQNNASVPSRAAKTARSVKEPQAPQGKKVKYDFEVVDRDSLDKKGGGRDRRMEFVIRNRNNRTSRSYTMISKGGGKWKVLDSGELYGEIDLDEDDTFLSYMRDDPGGAFQKYMNDVWTSKGNKSIDLLERH